MIDSLEHRKMPSLEIQVSFLLLKYLLSNLGNEATSVQFNDFFP